MPSWFPPFHVLLISVVSYAIKRGFHVNRFELFVAREIRLHLGILASLVLLKTASASVGQVRSALSPPQPSSRERLHRPYAKLFVINILVVLCVIAACSLHSRLCQEQVQIRLLPVGAIIAVYIIGMVIYPNLLRTSR